MGLPQAGQSVCTGRRYSVLVGSGRAAFLAMGGLLVSVPESPPYSQVTRPVNFAVLEKKLLEECDLWCIVSLPGGVFTAAGAGVKTNLLFFTRGKPTEK